MEGVARTSQEDWGWPGTERGRMAGQLLFRQRTYVYTFNGIIFIIAFEVDIFEKLGKTKMFYSQLNYYTTKNIK